MGGKRSGRGLFVATDIELPPEPGKAGPVGVKVGVENVAELEAVEGAVK